MTTLALLTVVATHAIVILIVCYMTATALVAVSLVVRKIEAGGNAGRAESFDRWARWLLPVVALAILGVTALILWN